MALPFCDVRFLILVVAVVVTAVVADHLGPFVVVSMDKVSLNNLSPLRLPTVSPTLFFPPLPPPSADSLGIFYRCSAGSASS